jgi:Putative DNA-binding domain
VAASSRRLTRVHWNPTLHLAWGKERLYFWRLFFSTYNRSRILPLVQGLLAEHQVGSFALYETHGFHDLILKAWLPTRYTQNDFRTRLEDALHPANMDVFYVDAALRHWPWGERTSPPEPDEHILADGMRDEEIQRINSGLLSASELTTYEKAKVVVRVRRARGLKFIVLVSNLQVPSTRTLSEMQVRLTQIIDAASTIRERSLYSGTGFGNSQFVILGRVPYGSFHAVTKEIVEPITAGLMTEVFGARTYTYFSATSDLLDFRDALPATSAVTIAVQQPVEYYLLQDESETLEIKGSAFVDLDRWLHGGGERTTVDAITDEGLLKTIVAFLNSEGGTLVLGALEAERYRDFLPQLGGCPRIGDYVCCGIKLDFHGRARSWDPYQRRLHEVIASRIKPGPLTPWYTIRKDEVDGQTLAVIHVRAPDHGWYYLYPAGRNPVPEFYIREGNRTTRLSGPEEDRYKAAHRRVPRAV